MLTAHALSPEHLVGTLKKGAYSYIPKQEMINIESYLSEVIKASKEGRQKPKKWFKKITPYFDEKFGSGWKDNHREFLRDFNLTHSREELEKIL